MFPLSIHVGPAGVFALVHTSPTLGHNKQASQATHQVLGVNFRRERVAHGRMDSRNDLRMLSRYSFNLKGERIGLSGEDAKSVGIV